MSNENSLSNGPEGTIAVNDAIAMTENWRTYLNASQQDFATKSFLIPIVNLKNILKYNPNAEDVRAYIGLESATDPLSGKLILVPVVDGKDVMYMPTDTQTPVTESSDESNVYDLTKACPPICSVDSPLNG